MEHEEETPDAQALSAQLQLRETELATLREQNAAMQADLAERSRKEIDERVTQVIRTYGTKKGLTDESRALLTAMASTMPDEFSREYPILPPEQAHLLTHFTKKGERAPDGGAGLPVLNLTEIAARLQRERGISFDLALQQAERLLNGGRS